ncbi:LacI family DNA-binding transcriptional regulator [Lysinibacter sp. HNR]|uniref:LacI family DNA-binding transcriptional regulator n=1 Tax=Lysinibacter sp. HNR TaxID=3031408 RepID=UPI002434B679|nr:LacI family DNA-binding transcriptional regulator [Lysinibacter sp. HNR]WGD37250.1 LacI family DNA-binding transcriptional regulator [Lysinibacter sp. HNR]
MTNNNKLPAPKRDVFGARGRSRATMKDVAALAGVGLSTVSRVVNGDPRVSDAKTAAVLKAIGHLGFRRNDSARQLRVGATQSIGLLIENVVDPFFSHLTQAVENYAFERDTLLLSASSTRDPERARRLVLAFCARRVDGLIVTPVDSTDSGYLQAELDAGIPIVCVDRPAVGIDADTVLSDGRGGAYKGVAHLIAHGHRRIACFTDRGAVYTAQQRVDGYRDALASAGIPYDPALVYSNTPDNEVFGAALRDMLSLDDPPTAIFTGNNRSTIVLLQELAHVENRLALVGFDDFELSDAVVPGVTVVAQDPTEMGKSAAEQLFRRIDGDTGASRMIVLGTTLIARGSGEIVPPAQP